MNDSAGLTAWFLVDRLVGDFEPSHRSANSAETGSYSLVIDESELANSRRNGVDAVSGQDARNLRIGRDCPNPTIGFRRAHGLHLQAHLARLQFRARVYGHCDPTRLRLLRQRYT